MHCFEFFFPLSRSFLWRKTEFGTFSEYDPPRERAWKQRFVWCKLGIHPLPGNAESLQLSGSVIYSFSEAANLYPF